MKKTLLCWLFIGSLLVMALTAVFAAKGNPPDDFTPSDVFIDICDHLFTEGSGYTAIDENGADVTARFVRDYYEEYLAGNYAIIFQAVTDDLHCITWK